MSLSGSTKSARPSGSTIPVEALISFFEARQGQLNGFRWKDWSDFKSSPNDREIGFEDQQIGHGDGETTVFQLTKTYRSGSQTYQRPILKPVLGSVRVGIQGDLATDTIDYQLDETTGTITFFSPPGEGAIVTAGFEFDVPVRFDTDAIQISVASFKAGEVPNVPIVELRL